MPESDIICVVCYRTLEDPEGRELVRCECGINYPAVGFFQRYKEDSGFRNHYRSVLRRDGWTVRYDTATGEVVVTDG